MNKYILIAVVLALTPCHLLAQGKTPPEMLLAEKMVAELSQVALPYTLFKNKLPERLQQERVNGDDLAALLDLCLEDIRRADEMCRKASEIERKFQEVIQHYPAGERRSTVIQNFYFEYDLIMQDRVTARVGLMMTFFTHRWAWEKRAVPTIKGWLFLLTDDLFNPKHDASFPHLRCFARIEMLFEDFPRAFLGL